MSEHARQGDEWYCKQERSEFSHSRAQANDGYCPYCFEYIDQYMY